MDKLRLAQKLIRKYQTKNPFEICESLGYIIVQAPLVGIRGCCCRKVRNTFIYIDSELDEHTKNVVCAHELYHALNHKEINRIYLENHTLQIPNRYEIACNQFAVCLLYPDNRELKDCAEMPVESIASMMGVSVEYAEYRMKLAAKLEFK